MGWTGRILRVNLTQGRCESEPLNLEWAEHFSDSEDWRRST